MRVSFHCDVNTNSDACKVHREESRMNLIRFLLGDARALHTLNELVCLQLSPQQPRPSPTARRRRWRPRRTPVVTKSPLGAPPPGTKTTALQPLPKGVSEWVSGSDCCCAIKFVRKALHRMSSKNTHEATRPAGALNPVGQIAGRAETKARISEILKFLLRHSCENVVFVLETVQSWENPF